VALVSGPRTAAADGDGGFAAPDRAWVNGFAAAPGDAPLRLKLPAREVDLRLDVGTAPALRVYLEVPGVVVIEPPPRPPAAAPAPTPVPAPTPAPTSGAAGASLAGGAR
jgi:hypothetical protein